MEFRQDYWDDKEAKESFKRFVFEIHGLDFFRWEEHRQWDNDYRPFSFFENGEVISSICIYHLEARFLGMNHKVAQISGVGTKKSHRRKGLNRELTNIALSQLEDKYEALFLFSDEEAKPFYSKCGFLELQDYCWVHKLQGFSCKAGLRKLDLQSEPDLKVLEDYCNLGVGVSDEFSALQPKLKMFHALYNSSINYSEISELGIVIAFLREGSTLTILDIMGKRIPAFSEFYPFLSKVSDSKIQFRFPIDKMKIENASKIKIDGNNAFTKGKFPIDKPVFPYTIFA